MLDSGATKPATEDAEPTATDRHCSAQNSGVQTQNQKQVRLSVPSDNDCTEVPHLNPYPSGLPYYTGSRTREVQQKRGMPSRMPRLSKCEGPPGSDGSQGEGEGDSGWVGRFEAWPSISSHRHSSIFLSPFLLRGLLHLATGVGQQRRGRALQSLPKTS